MISLEKQHQKGIVLITVMLIFVVAGFLAIQIHENQFYVQRLTMHSVIQDQAKAYLNGAESLAKMAMLEDEKLDEQGSGRKDHEMEAWAEVQSFPIDGGLIEGRIIDMQGRFNLANLQESDAARDVFIRLLEGLGIPSNPQLQPEDLLNAILDWQDEDQELRGIENTEDYYYLGLRSPYRTSGQGLTHLSELNLIKGFSLDDIKTLKPYVAILPVGTPININFVDSVLATALNEEDGASLFDNRPEEGYSLEDATSLSDEQKPKIPYTTFSQFYELRIQVELGGEIVRMRSFLFRPKSITRETPVQVMTRDAANIILNS